MDDDSSGDVTVARIVIVTSQTAGRVQVAVELARRLADAGHATTIASTFDIAGQVAALGATYVHLGAKVVDDVAALASGSRLTGLVRRLMELGSVHERREALIDSMGLDGVAQQVAELEPELVLIDVELPAVVMAVAGAGHSVAVWTTMQSVWKRPGLPPLGSPTLPGVGFGGSRVGLEVEWLVFLAKKRLRAMRHLVTRTGLDQMSQMREIARRSAFPLEGTSRNHWLLPFVFLDLPMLSFSARALEFPHDPSPSMRYVGPVLNREREVVRGGSDRLAAIYTRNASDPDRRLVYCAFGAWHKGDDRSFIHRVVDVGRRRRDWDIVIGLGSRIDQAEFDDVPDNVHLFAWAPQLEVLEHADAAIHHAGISSVNECIVSGVPMVLYPFDFLDQPGNAARVAFHGLGLVGTRDDTSLEIEKRLETV
ncbi:MAG: glycosyltransferase family 1 protein, partial [Acidimicrobiia bacterium]|nr:glycosyltransferase family 1 protein [Acidimicrobiia bacterium]